MATTNGSSGYGTPQRDGAMSMPPTNGTPMTQTTPDDATGQSGGFSAATNGRKRKADGTSSRGVANLTPEQLAKKRANDREAQRAIRERTRNQIETLERRIKELESQQPFQELQNALRQREQVQAENDDLKRRMQTIFSLLQPVAASQGLNDLAAATAQQSPLPMPQHQPQPQPQALMYPSQPTTLYDQPPFAQHHLHPDLRNIQPAQQPQPPRPNQSPASAARQYAQAAQAAQLQQQQHQQQHPHAHAHPQQQQRFSPHQHFQTAIAPAGVPQQQQLVPDMPNQSFGNFLVEDRKVRLTSPSQRDLIPTPTADVPVHMRLPRNQEATNALDSVMLDFMTERRRAAAQGTPSSSLVGPAYPSISSLLNPARAPKSHPLSKLFTDVLANLPEIDQIPEQVACLYIMFLVMRWRIAPTQENFERLPEWIRPIRCQLEVSHPIWFDNVPWPWMRDRMIKNCAAYPNERFGPVYCQTLSLNWPYDPQQCLLPRANSVQGAEATSAAVLDDDEEFMINPVFESHMRNLSNWSVGSSFANAMPELVEGVRIKDR
ncbi:hypothetical protein AUEXF2481DRAFT_727 [Aureobasidium subglaciale EXF-2481]|uniref:BZIP domain-containing protein n=1 Tax=Aureobasidium subglaciale (strain EXF-2481) TaxID=1043005 RepID=A0A074ZRC8_AURSE|nr:uncharacterized protein AUEXF2481DRAFT_727 [Aureobasidium subglaciale EXF-2481]KAI5210325.1 hypothetical protein E4T38_01956 [Aureobasidium subglaciale]KAI5229061.1 hypothetical protein E4T40_01937 [Aureobasidium subglaciale]KAI5232729.1 hypothetical protein E4T41_02157 [Aureobasidium subglaciale]KAI5266119.1 hypothetical protein E4T46_01733 [Aureobasidium subglaciale]KER00837.1 hypothetical protein AUEXF2481DRAFT_727 [Aureobasidium subglaciale EXF-2481]